MTADGERDRDLITVGANYKRPLSPVWVVQSESHYSCLWASRLSQCPPDVMESAGDLLPGDPDPRSEGYEEPDEEDKPRLLGAHDALDLYYFDQMAERDDAVRHLPRSPALSP